jgi:uncharacterized membrane protein
MAKIIKPSQAKINMRKKGEEALVWNPKEKKSRIYQEKIKQELKKDIDFEKFLRISGIISFIFFLAALFFMRGITGAAIGTERENVYGILILIILFFTWTALILVASRRKKSKVNVKNLIEENKI